MYLDVKSWVPPGTEVLVVDRGGDSGQHGSVARGTVCNVSVVFQAPGARPVGNLPPDGVFEGHPYRVLYHVGSGHASYHRRQIVPLADARRYPSLLGETLLTVFGLIADPEEPLAPKGDDDGK